MKKIIVLLLLVCAVIAGAAISATLQSHGNLVGPKRIPHKKLSAEQVALKNSIAFVLYDWRAYSETLPADQAKKWKNKKITQGLKQTRANSLRENHKYTVISSRSQGDKKIVVVQEQVGPSKNNYELTLQKATAGWVVIKFDVKKALY